MGLYYLSVENANVLLTLFGYEKLELEKFYFVTAKCVAREAGDNSNKPAMFRQYKYSFILHTKCFKRQ